MVTKTAIDRLPSLPQVLLQILEAIHSENADYPRIANIIRNDTAIAARLMTIANSSFYPSTGATGDKQPRCNSIERALLLLGTDTVKTIVITAATKQFFSHFTEADHHFMRSFWRRSLTAAHLAQVLATLTSYESPDTAYLCGLLTDVGQLLLNQQYPGDYQKLVHNQSPHGSALLAEEQARFGTTHCQEGAALVDSWHLPGSMGDAIRYHHEPTGLMLDAQHLVKIIHLSSLLSEQGELDDAALAAADSLFGFNEALTRELCQRIDQDINRLADNLSIELEVDNNSLAEAHQQLGRKLEELGEMAQLKEQFWQHNTDVALQTAISRSLYLTFGIKHSLLFLPDSERQQLRAQNITASDPEAAFILPLIAGRSLVSDCYLQKTTQQSGAEAALSVVDRQLLRVCQSPQLLCWPLHNCEDSASPIVGVLAIGADDAQCEQLQQRELLTSALKQHIGRNIAHHRQLPGDANEQPVADDSSYNTRIREAVHEAGNPLSIIRNYLETLRIKLGQGHDAQRNIDNIKQEIDRIGNILLRLKEPEQAASSNSSIDLNQTIQQTTDIARDSILITKGIKMRTHFDANIPALQANSDYIKQIITNLIKNAAEAFTNEQGKMITITTDALVKLQGKDYAAIYVEDNGPGIPAAIKSALYTPVTSTKAGNHSGLGLSIVKKLVDAMDGSIVCRSNEHGTQFQILLPR